MRRTALLAALCFGYCALAFAEKPADQAAPKTKLEAFESQTGNVIVRGFSRIAVIPGEYGAVTVESKEFTNAGTGRKEYGVTLEVQRSAERKNTSFIDYDEIDALLAGIDYISKLDRTATRFDNFQADYRTKGDLEFSIFSEDNDVMLAVSSGTIGKVTAYFKVKTLARIRQAIADAKTKIDGLK
ncbi:MAG: hypothetical protein HY940_08300 [Gammaproteobacteria bacterium]|nr:hypothetical protein [Gammaproteobacteria bacterium]